MPAFAITTTQSQSFGGIPNMTGALTFNQFNTSLGTLQSIQVLLYLESSNGEVILDNDGAGAASGTFEFGATGNLSATDVAMFDTSFQPIPSQVGAYYTGAFNLAANTGDGAFDFDSTGPDGMMYAGQLEGDVSAGYVANTFWSAGTKGFLGTGTYNINYAINQWLNYGSVGGIEYAINPVDVTGHVTIAYTYNAVPEPATIAMLSIGILVSIKRKKA
jgi:hypothetical protein